MQQKYAVCCSNCDRCTDRGFILVFRYGIGLFHPLHRLQSEHVPCTGHQYRYDKDHRPDAFQWHRGTFQWPLQYQGFADINMGRGAPSLLSAAWFIIGEARAEKSAEIFVSSLLTVALGSIIYYLVMQVVLWLGLTQ